VNTFKLIVLPLAILLIGLGILIGATPLGNPPRFNVGWLLVLFGTILAGVAMVLDLTATS